MDKNVNDMVVDIESEVQYTCSQIGKHKLDERVISAMLKVPRDQFVPANVKHLAFDNFSLPIGYGQTVSRPYIVALMTDLLQLKPQHTVLEIGTGSGYQATILSMLCRQVYTIERIPELSSIAKQRFEELGRNNIKTFVGNGYDGLPEFAPYNAIIVTASATQIPKSLLAQLKPGGNLVIPIGLAGMNQELLLVKKDNKNKFTIDSILYVEFLPLVNDNIYSSGESVN